MAVGIADVTFLGIELKTTIKLQSGRSRNRIDNAADDLQSLEIRSRKKILGLKVRLRILDLKDNIAVEIGNEEIAAKGPSDDKESNRQQIIDTILAEMIDDDRNNVTHIIRTEDVQRDYSGKQSYDSDKQ